MEKGAGSNKSADLTVPSGAGPRDEADSMPLLLFPFSSPPSARFLFPPTCRNFKVDRQHSIHPIARLKDSEVQRDADRLVNYFTSV